MIKQMEKNYYDLLKIPYETTEAAIKEAYGRAKTMYSNDSAATCSPFSNEQREAMLAEITDAYNTLKDPLKRRTYDDERASSARENNTDNEKSLLFLHNSVSESSQKDRKSVTLKTPLAVMNENDPMTTEQYRILYTRIEEIISSNSYKCFAVTSAVKGEGKTLTSMNMAYLMAHEFKKKVLLIEGDLKNPSLSPYFLTGLPAKGLIDVVRGNAELNDSIVQLKNSNLYILPAGGRVKNSSEFLSSDRMHKILSSLKEEFDILIIDSPPILSLADMNILSKLVDGVLLVVRAGETPKDIVLKAVHSLSSDKIIGVILNGAERSMKKYWRRVYY